MLFSQRPISCERRSTPDNGVRDCTGRPLPCAPYTSSPRLFVKLVLILYSSFTLHSLLRGIEFAPVKGCPFHSMLHVRVADEYLRDGLPASIICIQRSFTKPLKPCCSSNSLTSCGACSQPRCVPLLERRAITVCNPELRCRYCSQYLRAYPLEVTRPWCRN